MTHKKLRIVFDAMPLINNKSGVGYYTEGLINALSKVGGDEIELKGFYFNFLGRKKITHLPKAGNIQYIESRVVPGKLLNICRRLGFQIPLEFLTHQSADIALFTNYVSLPSITKIKKIVAVHDLSFIDCPEFVSQKNRDFLRKWVPQSIKHAACIVTISRFTESRISDVYKINPSRIHITPIPAAKQEKPDYSVLSKFNLEQDYILFVGTIEPRKNIVNLLKAFEILVDKHGVTLPLVLAGGKGWNDDEILAKIGRLKDKNIPIITTGYITGNERSALYEKALLCVLPSLYEGFGMPILEAMDHGKAVACSDIPVLHEVAGNAAIYFNEKSPDAIAEGLKKLILNPTQLKTYESLSNAHMALFPAWKEVADDFLNRIKELV